MVRTPSCDKSGLRKGTWTPEEDRKLIAYITRYGSWNWRQLPRFAGLARCGKSCRLRWMNYLRPNLKRGNFSQEEEELIIKLHTKLGNRWSAIAGELPGRTDNEIKNHWHTSLKKRFQENESVTSDEEGTPDQSKDKESTTLEVPHVTTTYQELSELNSTLKSNTSQISDITTSPPSSPTSSSSSELSLSITNSSAASNNNSLAIGDFDDLAFLDGSFWTESYSDLAEILQTTPSGGSNDRNGSSAAVDQSSAAAQHYNSNQMFDDQDKELESLLEELPMIDENFFLTAQQQHPPQYVGNDVSHVQSELLMTSPSDQYFSFSPLCGTDLWSTQTQNSNFLYNDKLF